VISVFLLEAGENCALLGYYTFSSNFLLMFWDNLLAPSARVNNKKKYLMGTTGCPEKSVRNHHYLLRNNPEKCSSQTSGSYHVSHCK
jgi:hypothetical protein